MDQLKEIYAYFVPPERQQFRHALAYWCANGDVKVTPERFYVSDVRMALLAGVAIGVFAVIMF